MIIENNSIDLIIETLTAASQNFSSDIFKKDNKRKLISFAKEFIPYDVNALSLFIHLVNQDIFEEFYFYKEIVTEEFLKRLQKSQRKIKGKIPVSSELQEEIFRRISDFFEEKINLESQKVLNEIKKSELTHLFVNGEKIYFGGKTVIGRGSDCDIVINNSTVSRHHAMIVQAGEFYLLHDLHSTNKTFLNNRAVSPNRYISLKSGDAIRLGDITVYFLQDAQ